MVSSSFGLLLFLVLASFCSHSHQHSINLTLDDELFNGRILSNATFRSVDTVEILEFSNIYIIIIENGSLCFPSPKEIIFRDVSAVPLNKSHFGVCPSLTELVFDHSHMTISDETFSGLFNLRKLHFVEQYMSKISKNFLKNLTSLERLSFTCVGMETIEVGAFNDLRSLKHLSFAENGLTSFEGLLTPNLQQLTTLSIGFEESLESFPFNDLRHVPNLEELELTSISNMTGIDQFDATVLLKLRSLTLSSTKLAYFPWAYLQCVPNLEILRLDGSRITNIMSDKLLINTTTKLRELDLGYSQLKQFPFSVLQHMPHLETLHLEYNGLETVFDDLRFNVEASRRNLLTSKNIRQLHLNNNKLKLFPWNSLQYMPQLEELNLAFNKIENVFDDLTMNVSKLKKLNLAYNDLKKIGWNKFEYMPKLDNLNLESNKITHAFGELMTVNMSQLQTLDLSCNNLSDFQWHYLQYTPNLKELKLYENKIQSIDANSDLYLSKLEDFSICGNPLDSTSIRRVKRIKAGKFVRLCFSR